MVWSKLPPPPLFIIIYTFFTRKLREIYFTKGSWKQNWLRENVVKYMRIGEFFHKNFAGQVVTLFNCPKGRDGSVMLIKGR